jgi:N-glycosylase/DNA lyase
VLRLHDGSLCGVQIRQRDGTLRIDTAAKGTLTPAQRNEIKSIVASMLRLDESLDEFFALTKRYPEYRWVIRLGAGRLLRAQTVFEDIVKMVCTTNCSWALTKIITDNLTMKLGAELSPGLGVFPDAAAIASVSESYLRNEIRCGYRAPYLLEFSESVASGSRDVERWRHWDGTTEQLFKEMRSVKGVGEYAAGALMKLVGCYEYLALDSWCRATFAELHGNGRKVSDRTIEKYYRPFGKWRGLFLWVDLTRHWFAKKFPF